VTRLFGLRDQAGAGVEDKSTGSDSDDKERNSKFYENFCVTQELHRAGPASWKLDPGYSRKDGKTSTAESHWFGMPTK
jgi:hypothetical protein